MHPCLIKEPFNDPGWIFEVKYDGFRMLAYIESGKVTLYSRKKTNFTKRFSLIADSLCGLKCSAVLDGEITVLDENGVSDFYKLQYYSPKKPQSLVYFVFDIMRFNDKDLCSTPLLKRKALLKKMLPKSEHVRFVDNIKENGIEFFNLLEENHAEGMVCKLKNSLYYPGKRSDNWRKVKTQFHKELLQKYPREF
ncbi:MAG: RNA ligase family protein [Methanococcaceae archaeon]